MTPPNLILLAALGNAHQALRSKGVEGIPADLVITSGSDGSHMDGSRHYDYAALDVRSKTFPQAIKLPFLKAVLRRLGTPVVVETPTGPGYQTSDGRWLGILEYQGQPREHFHFEQN